MEVIDPRNIKSEPVEWLWNNRIPRGFMSFLAGRSGQGKTLAAAHIAAEVTKEGGRVLFSAAEDDHSKMTKPRLEAAGARMDRLKLANFRFPDQLSEVEQLIAKYHFDLIIMDPLVLHLGAGINRMSDSIRKFTDPIANPTNGLCKRTNVAVLVVEHIKKNVSASSDWQNAMAGSGSGFPAACRMGFFFGTDPDNDGQKILANPKHNIAAQRPALAFDTDCVDLDDMSDETPIDATPFLVEVGETVCDPMRLVASSKGEQGRSPVKRDAAAEWLTQLLVKAGGPVKASTIYSEGKAAGFSRKTLMRARLEMDYPRNPSKGGPGHTWELSDDVKQAILEANESAGESYTTGNETVVAEVAAPAVPTPEPATPEPEPQPAMLSQADLDALLGE